MRAIASGQALWLQAKNGVGGVVKAEVKKTSMQKSMELALLKRDPSIWCPICAIDLSSSIVALTHYKGKKHLTKFEKSKGPWFRKNP